MTGYDALGQDYLVKAGYPATGMVRLHQLLVDEETAAPSLLRTMFSTHPMSHERMQAAQAAADNQYRISNSQDARRERFMDSTASLRRIRPTINACKNGETAMAAKQYTVAQVEFESAIAKTPRDYASNLRMAQCLQAQGETGRAGTYASVAREIYPQEAQAHKLSGVLALQQRDPGSAFEHLDRFDRLLPGDAGTTFLKGIALEGIGNRQAAAQHYLAYLRQSQQGNAAQYSYSRLKAWGVVK